MKKLLILTISELNKLAIECQCGTETILDLMKPIPVPSACPGCHMQWNEISIQVPIQSIKNGFQALNGVSQPKLTFRAIRDDW